MTTAANLDPAERAKFDAHAPAWWNPAGPLHTLHAVNPLRLAYVARHVPLAGALVADLGCGGGILAEALARSGAHVTGVDLSPAAIGVARAHAEGEGAAIRYLECAPEALAAQEPHAYDLVTCMELLEHVPDPAAVVNAAAALLRPGGTAVFATLSRTPKAFAQAIVAAEYVLRLLPRGTHQYTRFLRPSELGAMCRHARLQVTDVTGLTYNPLTRGYRLTRSPAVNYFLTARAAGAP
jgi:2-polyprenyl-6-hydroxyphenyl methylase / 3-demethylubiquinone-9 3-methyltransferase